MCTVQWPNDACRVKSDILFHQSRTASDNIKNMALFSIVNHHFLLEAFCTIGLGLSVKVSFFLMKAITSYSVLCS